MTIKCADLLGASLGFASGSWHPQIFSSILFSILGNTVLEIFLLFCFCFLTPRFYVLKVTFGSRRARCEDYWVRQLGCLFESELANQTQETQTGFNQYYSYWTFWKEAIRRPARRHSIISSLGGLAGTLVAVFLCSLPHTGTRCKSQGIWVTLSQSGHFPHQSCIWFSSSLGSACQLADPQAQVFVSHNVEGETTVPIYLTLLFPRKQDRGGQEVILRLAQLSQAWY